jgi:large subunit ribosomal protein L16
MSLQPARVKYRRMHRGSRAGMATRAIHIDFGTYGLQTLERAWLKGTQIEAARVALTRNMKRKGKVWIRVFPQKSVSKKPLETRMGKGKGAPEFWVAVVRPGNILFEMEGVPENTARESFALAAAKLPIRTRFIVRRQLAAA